MSPGDKRGFLTRARGNKSAPGLLHFCTPFRGSAIGSTPAFGAGYPGSSPGPGATCFILRTEPAGSFYSRAENFQKKSDDRYAAETRRGLGGGTTFSSVGRFVFRCRSLRSNSFSNSCSEQTHTVGRVFRFELTTPPSGRSHAQSVLPEANV